ncbi:hypothetical protein LCGC14_1874540 [marine sediment metagenome]|uniref:Uncharacterized protein n=1 Tax=marine sediment metagenome TaxID=412755 RepID=A0A0F9II18_9ZZZZ
MTKSEQQYAIDRIAGLCRQKCYAIEEAMPVTKAKKITYGQALSRIKAGKIRLIHRIKDRGLYRSDDFDDVFDVKDHHDYNGSDGYDEKACSKKCAPIHAEALRIKDQIMLGDAVEALKMIEAFAKM